jgi:hypothetical protein
MLFHCSTILVIQILFKKIKLYSIFLKNIDTNVPINEILFNSFTLVSFIKVFKSPKIQMEHSHLIVELNATQNSKNKI